MNGVKRTTQSIAGWWKGLRTLWKVVIVVVVAIVLFSLLGGSKSEGGTTVETVKAQNIARTIAASGSVVSSTDLSLSFESAKIVGVVNVKVGDTVKAGAILASQKNATERASYNSARASLMAAEARYQKVLDGSSNEEIALAQVQLENSKKTQDNLVANARRKLYSDDLVADPQASNTTSMIPVISGVYNSTEEGEYRISFENYSKTELRISGLERVSGQADDIPRAFGTRGLRIAFPSTAYSVSDAWKVLVPNKSGANYTTNLNAYQAAVETRNAVIAEKQAELDLKRATARQPEVDTALADIVIARAGVEQALATLEKTILRAPADGTITKVDTKVGELPPLDKEVFVLQDVSNLYLEADVNESNVALLAVGQQVVVTFDALGNSEYRATVSSIDPAATITDGIVNYKVKALLDQSENIRPGMTANMIVRIADRSNVIAVPGRFVRQEDDAMVVDVVTDSRRMTTIVRPVTLGLRADGDMVEILTGLSAGETIAWKSAE